MALTFRTFRQEIFQENYMEPILAIRCIKGVNEVCKKWCIAMIPCMHHLGWMPKNLRSFLVWKIKCASNRYDASEYTWWYSDYAVVVVYVNSDCQKKSWDLASALPGRAGAEAFGMDAGCFHWRLHRCICMQPAWKGWSIRKSSQGNAKIPGVHNCDVEEVGWLMIWFRCGGLLEAFSSPQRLPRWQGVS